MKSFDSENRSVSRISIVSTTASVQFFRVLFVRIKHWVVSSKALIPTLEWRLFIVVPVKEISILDFALDFDENQRSKVFFPVGDKLNGGAFDS